MKSIHFRATGKVQGVWFRESTKQEALRLGLAGWVQNEPDGSVTGQAEGPDEQVAALQDWLAHGPEQARVESVDIAEVSPARFATFEVRRPPQGQ